MTPTRSIELALECASPTRFTKHATLPAPLPMLDEPGLVTVFSPGRPDWNWRHPAITSNACCASGSTLGVDGLRIEVPHALFKVEGLPDAPTAAAVVDGLRSNPLVGEVNLEPDPAARYTRADEMHRAFTFAFVRLGWDVMAWAAVGPALESGRVTHGGTPTWALENHDVVRTVTLFGSGELGARPRAALLALLGFPGASYVYQGQELGLPQVNVPPDPPKPNHPPSCATPNPRRRNTGPNPVSWRKKLHDPR
ncbi:alpha-amylase family glycosyl hydrolase [Paenarthrobacter ureafaciens]|uniref:alpha-amylase family glycosyl hydrolase n=1 Tax=Paenarthrobacter ureafaciens TaxID=37931 RepID=UPI001FB46BA3|nr:alpha-amylase family glycosyl hydrolase [Paenarthrobacter ureafaciens]UOD82306.1 alpha-amylase family glycosyl hydrolase [Paenarthrobacter ureafaciens]WNZ05804.1 alpha-amylase family glycosyl hydrolase [Paenarthrobacter ureafaciens]